MKFDLDHTIPDLTGEPIIDPTTQKELTMRHAARAALVAPRADGQGFSNTDTLRRYDLAMQVLSKPGHVDLSAEEVVLITDALATVFAPLVAGAVAHHLKNPLPALKSAKAHAG